MLSFLTCPAVLWPNARMFGRKNNRWLLVELIHARSWGRRNRKQIATGYRDDLEELDAKGQWSLWKENEVGEDLFTLRGVNGKKGPVEFWDGEGSVKRHERHKGTCCISIWLTRWVMVGWLRYMGLSEQNGHNITNTDPRVRTCRLVTGEISC